MNFHGFSLSQWLNSTLHYSTHQVRGPSDRSIEISSDAFNTVHLSPESVLLIRPSLLRSDHNFPKKHTGIDIEGLCDLGIVLAKICDANSHKFVYEFWSNMLIARSDELMRIQFVYSFAVLLVIRNHHCPIELRFPSTLSDPFESSLLANLFDKTAKVAHEMASRSWWTECHQLATINRC